MVPEIPDTFKRLETRKRDYTTTARAHMKGAPRLIRLTKGTIQEYIELTPYQSFCWKTLGGYIKRKGKENPKLEDDLLKAHMRIRPEEYVAMTLMSTILATIVGIIVAIVLGWFFLTILNVWILIRIITIIILILIPPLLTYVLCMSIPASKAKARARDINARMLPAMNFVSTMASADVNVDVIFKELSRQPVYGEIRNEAAWITRDTELLGVDILTALRKGSQRCPSTKFQDLLQGVVTTSTSGGQLKPYFMVKAEECEKESKLDLRKKIETLGLLADSFVTVVVAFPLFLVIILALMALIQANPAFMMNLLYMIVGLMVPLSQFGFIFVVWNMSQEV